MRRTMIIGVIGATALTIGLGVGATLAASDPIPSIEDMTSMMDGNGMAGMMDGNGMAGMMDGNGMAGMMGESGMMDAAGMDAMHTAMHQALEDKVPADVLAACDEAHMSMSGASAPSSIDAATNHAAHHPGGKP